MTRWLKPAKTIYKIVGGVFLIVGASVWYALAHNAAAVAGLLIGIGALLLLEGIYRKLSILEDVEPMDRMAEMIGHAQNRILVTSGRLDAHAWIDGSQGRMPDVVAERLAQGVDIEIVVRDIDERSVPLFRELEERFPDRLHLSQADVNPIPHGMLVDDTFLRIERPHAAGSNVDRHNAFIPDPGPAGALFEATFEKYRKRSKRLDLSAA